MKKKIVSLASIFITLISATANASQDQVLNCSNGSNKVQITILPVSGDPSLKVLSLKGDLLIIASDPQGNNNVGKFAQVEAQLVGEASSQAGWFSGLIENQDGSNVKINPQLINVDLSTSTDGAVTLSIYDNDRIFQRGFGLWLDCK